MGPSILDVVQHYQRSIERSQNDGGRLLYCIDKLYNLPVKVEHLQQTGIGKTVNSLRKFNGEIGVAAKALVTKWKAMVAAEEDPVPLVSHHNRVMLQNTNGYRGSSDDEQSQQRHLPQKEKNKCTEEITSGSESQTEKHHKTYEKPKTDDRGARDKEKERLKAKECKDDARRGASTSKHHNSSGSSSSKRKDETQLQHHTAAKEKSVQERTKEKDNRHHKEHAERNDAKKQKKHKYEKNEKERHKLSSSTAHSPSTRPSTSSAIAAANAHSPSSSSHKRPHYSDNENFKTPAPPAKISKNSKTHKLADENEDEDDGGFDSSMGTNFADVLGMLNIPTKKSKKPVGITNASSSNESPPKSSSTKMKAEKSSTSSSSASTSSSASRPAGKPALLISAAKLEPLDPSIVLDLPTISPNYKPMPLNQTVMDCVFNTSNSSASKAQQRFASEAEALSHGISSKTMRTKIYSGVRTGQIHQVPSLFDLCIRVLQRNIDALEYTGGVPFEVLRAVLERASPEQLLVFEEYNPYLMEDSDVLWQQHVQRKYRTQRRQEMETWREMFMRCQEAEARRLSILAESIKQSQKAIAAPVRKTQLAFVDSMVKPPRNIQRKQEQYGTKSKLVATPAARVASLSSVVPNATKVGDVRLRVSSGVRDAAQVSAVRPKKAPLMAKTLQFMRGRNKR